MNKKKKVNKNRRGNEDSDASKYSLALETDNEKSSEEDEKEVKKSKKKKHNKNNCVIIAGNIIQQIGGDNRQTPSLTCYLFPKASHRQREDNLTVQAEDPSCRHGQAHHQNKIWECPRYQGPGRTIPQVHCHR